MSQNASPETHTETIPDVFDLPALEQALAATVFAGKLHFSLVTESTNTDALYAARMGAPHGSVYFADEQLAGRGRGNHAWQSAASEGLYVSVLLRTPIQADRQLLIPLASGLAAAGAIRATTGLAVDLRWPNDLLLSSNGVPRKTGGILSEGKLEDGAVAFTVVGIGINVHQRTFAQELSTPATSLDLEAGVPGDRPSSLGWEARRRVLRQALLVALLRSLEREMVGLPDPASVQSIPRRFEDASTWVRGREVEVHGPQACIGVTAGLDQQGFLLVRTAHGLATVQTGGIRAVEKN